MLSQLTNLFKSSKETPEQLFLKENDLVFAVSLTRKNQNHVSIDKAESSTLGTRIIPPLLAYFCVKGFSVKTSCLLQERKDERIKISLRST